MCQANKVNMTKAKPPIYSITPRTSTLPFENIAVDLIVKLPQSQGYNSILTITDHDCTKASIFLLCNKSIDTAGIAELYAHHVFPHYSIPRHVISDQDMRFTAAFLKELCRILNIQQNISMAYHLQTDG